MIEVVIPGPPRAQPRARAYARQRKDGQWKASVYENSNARRWKERAAMTMLEARTKAKASIMEGPVSLMVCAIWPCPTSGSKKGAQREWRTSRGDADNVAKAIMDAGNGVLWKDDAQVVLLTVYKIRAGYGESERVEIRVSTPPTVPH